MSFKLTYSTMFDPPAELHANFDSAVARALAKLGGRHALHMGGEEREAARYFVKSNPADCQQDRKSTRLNSSHGYISYAVFCLKKKKNNQYCIRARDDRRT